MHPLGSPVLTVAQNKMNIKQLEQIRDAHSQDLHALSYHPIGSGCSKSLVKNALSKQTSQVVLSREACGLPNLSVLLSQACLNGDWATAAMDEMAYKVCMPDFVHVQSQMWLEL